MIRFSNVQGDVFVDDRRRDDRLMARDGLALDPGGDYLVATTQSSSADVQAYGRTIQLGRFSYALEPDQGPRGQAQRILVGAEDEAVPGQALGPRRRAHVTPRWPGALAPRPRRTIFPSAW